MSAMNRHNTTEPASRAAGNPPQGLAHVVPVPVLDTSQQLPVEEQTDRAANRHMLLAMLISTLFHTWIPILLGLLMFASVPEGQPPDLVASIENSDEERLPSILQTVSQIKTVARPNQGIETGQVSQDRTAAPSGMMIKSPLVVAARKPRLVEALPEFDARQLFTPVGNPGGGYEGRTQARRAQLVRERGGSPQSELAVDRGLKWLAGVQRSDGSWRFDLTLQDGGRPQGSKPGTLASTTASTALAVLPFLGAGSTHEDGEYREVVRRALYYLRSRMIETDQGGDLREGTMYAQGLASIALCEAYAMTGDEAVRPDAQRAIDFIVHAQHPAGGWRYFPGQAGDTTSTGWQLMALKSGQHGKLNIPSPVFRSAESFLESVSSNGGVYYGYQQKERSKTNTAIGLLCRMYLGWKRDNETLRKGVYYLAKEGPSANNLYYDYYATQVMSHYGGKQWKKWNHKMRDHLVATQSAEGLDAGSWYFVESHTLSAGRLYHTAMAIMILEVYYRHMPLYRDEAILESF